MNRFPLGVLVSRRMHGGSRAGRTSRPSRTTASQGPGWLPAPKDWTGSPRNQNADGSWGKTYTIAVTSFA